MNICSFVKHFVTFFCKKLDNFNSLAHNMIYKNNIRIIIKALGAWDK